MKITVNAIKIRGDNKEDVMRQAENVINGDDGDFRQVGKIFRKFNLHKFRWVYEIELVDMEDFQNQVNKL